MVLEMVIVVDAIGAEGHGSEQLQKRQESSHRCCHALSGQLSGWW